MARTKDPSDYWFNKFKEVKKTLESVFSYKAIAIEHVGSTFFGNKAKPLLDILVVVKDINDIFKEKEKMKEFGYLWEDNYIAPDTSFIYKLEGEGGEERKIEKTFMLFLPDTLRLIISYYREIIFLPTQKN
ncbi:MAG: GrpB family protein [Candidatus Paceibacterota bacterium]